MNWYLKVLKQYADFRGRARRSEFWMFTLFYVIIYIVATILDNVLGTTFKIMGGVSLPYGWIVALYVLATFVPSLAVYVRRLHDIGKSGWYYFIAFIPFVGFIILLVWFCKDGQPEENKWGKNPKD